MSNGYFSTCTAWVANAWPRRWALSSTISPSRVRNSIPCSKKRPARPYHVGVNWKGEKHRIDVDGLSMAYVERGTGDPIVFLHGNPTSSYLWRNIIPHLEVRGRCIAPDLVGMGDSEKLLSSGPGRYRFVEHRAYLDGLLAGLGVTERVILVVHDWGSALGFDWARRHPRAVRGVAYMEAIMAPLRQPLGEPFASLRSAAGEQMVLQDNLFIERLLPSGMLRQLTPGEHDEYRRPYL